MPSDASRARKLFYRLDQDGNGSIEKEEVVVLHETGPETFAAMHADKDGKTTMSEWLGFVAGVEQKGGEKAGSFLMRRLETKLNAAKPDTAAVAPVLDTSDVDAMKAEGEALRVQVSTLQAQLKQAQEHVAESDAHVEHVLERHVGKASGAAAVGVDTSALDAVGVQGCCEPGRPTASPRTTRPATHGS